MNVYMLLRFLIIWDCRHHHDSVQWLCQVLWPHHHSSVWWYFVNYWPCCRIAKYSGWSLTLWTQREGQPMWFFQSWNDFESSIIRGTPWLIALQSGVSLKIFVSEWLYIYIFFPYISIWKTHRWAEINIYWWTTILMLTGLEYVAEIDVVRVRRTPILITPIMIIPSWSSNPSFHVLKD